uniref:'chromo' domain containing protein n=1 Tax=Steinernema glaseri TaxID=37863 RepID=A0A1I7Z227_9BILA
MHLGGGMAIATPLLKGKQSSLKIPSLQPGGRTALGMLAVGGRVSRDFALKGRQYLVKVSHFMRRLAFATTTTVGNPSEGWRGNGLGGRDAFPYGRIGGPPGGRRQFESDPTEYDVNGEGRREGMGAFRGRGQLGAGSSNDELNGNTNGGRRYNFGDSGARRGNGLGGNGASANGRIGGAPGGRREFGADPIEGENDNAESGRKYPFAGSRGPFDGNRGGRRGGRGRHGKRHRHCNGTTEAPSIFRRDHDYCIPPVIASITTPSEVLSS